MSKKILFIIIIISQTVIVSAQNISSEINESKEIVSSYVSPLSNALGTGLNNAWWSTAKPHKKLGFDMTFSITPVIIPENEKSFMIGSTGSFRGNETATIFGAEGSNLNYGDSTIIKMPNGLGIGFVATPMLQASIGLPKKTEISLRYSPEFKIKSFKLGIVGVGLKHDLFQWIPVLKKAPIDFSIMAGHTRLNTDFTIDQQGIALNLKATTVNLLLSKKISLVTGYLGAGYNHTSSDLEITLNGDDSFIHQMGHIVDSDELKNIELITHSDYKANIGARVQLALLAINANYTLTSLGYKLYTISIGINVR